MGINIEHENTFEKMLNDGFNLFAGAGFSVLAKDTKGRNLPIGNILKDELIKEFDCEKYSNLDLPKLCKILESNQKNRFYSYLRERYSVGSFDNRYLVLENLNLKAIFTTNIDNLINKIFENSERYYINDMMIHGPNLCDRAAIDYIPLHGSILNEYIPLTFSTMDIASTFQFEADKWHMLCQRIQKTATIFWGYKLEDAGTLQALNPKTIGEKDHKPKWIVLRSQEEASVDYFKTMDFSIITGDTESLLDYFKNAKTIKETKVYLYSSTKSLFPNECVPEKPTGPIRPIKYFYMGSEPTWHDIYSGKIYKTSHYQDVMNKINSGKNNLIIGMPACGKTTLMMQIAADISFKGHKLITQRMTQDKASLIVRHLRDNPAIIFIDNYSDNIEATNILEKASNIQIVGFEREYNIDIASHLFNISNYTVSDITGLIDRDIQGILSKIPSDMIRQHKTAFDIDTSSLSIYEVVESNIISASLKQRFKKVLEELERISYDLHDLFVMCCYVHKCRTPVSFDMVYAFLRDERNPRFDYHRVYDLIDQLGALIQDDYDVLIDERDQDFFKPRSIFVSEAVLNEVSQYGLKRTILNFHEKVSTYRICDYHTFKRYAFDKDIMLKAFSDWSEGRDFYKNMHHRDRSPYILQQGALYLSKKKRFEDAFRWIDQAVVESENRIFSIRNSYAIILFRANIDSTGDSDIKAHTLKESMDILAECYCDDKRKTYHALTFASQAIEYWGVYHNEIARNYLETAKEWLENEMQKNQHSSSVKKLLKMVENKLGKK